jgi:hypothetical protein
MFNPTQIVIEAFASELKLTYERTYGLLEPSYPGVIGLWLAFLLRTAAQQPMSALGQKRTYAAICLQQSQSAHQQRRRAAVTSLSKTF